MKKLTNILRGSQITPFERVKLLVHNNVYAEKTGKNNLTESNLFTLNKGWNPTKSFEVTEYNKYIDIARLEASMKIDTKMFLSESEITLLRNQRLLDYFVSNKMIFKRLSGCKFLKTITEEDSLEFLAQSSYLEYQKVLHIFTFNNLSKEVQNDLLLLDECTKYEKNYMRDQVFLYERLKNGDELSKQDKNFIIDQIYSCIYYEKFKKMKNNNSEKDGFLIHRSFADLPVKDIFQKIIDDAHIIYEEQKDSFGEDLLSAVEEYTKSKDISMESLIKEKLFQWLSDGLFLEEYKALFMSESFNTLSGSTRKNHKKLFMIWYKELQKSKQYFKNLFDTGRLIKQNIEIDFLGILKLTEIITTKSLLACNEDLVFVKEYKQQIEIFLPIASMFLFIKKNTDPIKCYKTLCEFKNISQEISAIFDIDMTEKYNGFIDSYCKEINLFNRSLSLLVDKAVEHLYMDESMIYIIDIIENNFSFDIEKDEGIYTIAELYSTELKKLTE